MGEILLESTAQALTDQLALDRQGEVGDDKDLPVSSNGSSVQTEGEEPSTDDEAQQGTDEPLTAEILAEKAGISVADLYSKLQLKIDDETVTLEQFKDRGRELNKVDLGASELARDRAVFQSERLKQTEELNAWIGAIQSGNATQADVQSIADQSEALKAAADTRTRALIPEWKNGEVAATDKAAIGDMLTQFGLPKGSEQMIHDPNTWLMLRYFHQLDQRMGKALKEVRQPRHKGQRAPSKAAPKSALKGLSSDSAAMLEALRHGS